MTKLDENPVKVSPPAPDQHARRLDELRWGTVWSAMQVPAGSRLAIADVEYATAQLGVPPTCRQPNQFEGMSATVMRLPVVTSARMRT